MSLRTKNTYGEITITDEAVANVAGWIVTAWWTKFRANFPTLWRTCSDAAAGAGA